MRLRPRAPLFPYTTLFRSTAAPASLGGEGQIVSGIIIKVNRDSVVVDIGGKSEGVISKNEFVDAQGALDRKSTRLNSSHGYISYAVFCLKKKTYYISWRPC